MAAFDREQQDDQDDQADDGPGMGTARARAIVSPASWQASRIPNAFGIAAYQPIALPVRRGSAAPYNLPCFRSAATAHTLAALSERSGSQFT